MHQTQSIIRLRREILTDIISPGLEESAIKEKAQRLGVIGGIITELQFQQLQNVIICDLIDEVVAFLRSDDAKQIYRYAEHFSARASFSSVICEKLPSRIQAIFQLAPPEPSFWRWAVSWIKT